MTGGFSIGRSWLALVRRKSGEIRKAAVLASNDWPGVWKSLLPVSVVFVQCTGEFHFYGIVVFSVRVYRRTREIACSRDILGICFFLVSFEADVSGEDRVRAVAVCSLFTSVLKRLRWIFSCVRLRVSLFVRDLTFVYSISVVDKFL